jgi:RNA polymerase sigma-70 factor (ECF subfamily)
MQSLMVQDPRQDKTPDDSEAKARAEDMAALMAAIVGRDRTAFASLFAYYAPRVKSYLRRRRADERLAEDLVQDVMLTVWRKAELFDPAKASVSTWVFTIARNRFIDAMRQQNRPDLDPDDPSLAPEAPVPADVGLASIEIGQRVRNAMTTLPADQAEVVTLSFLEGLPHSEIADRLAIPLGTVKSRLRLAFARLRAALEDLQ